MGKAIKKVADPLGLFKSPQDTTQAKSPIAADVLQAQREALGSQRAVITRRQAELTKDPTKRALGQVTREERALAGAADDARRRLRERIAQRGLGKSSIGLSQEVGIGQRLAERQLAVRASLPERIQGIREQRLRALEGTSSRILAGQNVPIRFEDVTTRGKSKLPIIGALGGGIIGGIYGGPGGAKLGSSVGGAAGSLAAQNKGRA